MRLYSLLACLLLVPTLTLGEDAPAKPLTPAEAAKKVREKITVEMLVKSSGGNDLNSEVDFMADANFTIFIPKDTKEKFKKLGIANPAEHFDKKTIQATGTVILVEKKPRIAIVEPDQLKIIEKK
jgi:hypothetical protein